MSHTPFRRYIWTNIIIGLDFDTIRRNLGLKEFVLTEAAMNDEYQALLEALPPSMQDIVKKRGEFKLDNEHIIHIQWLKTLDVLDYFRFKKTPPHKPGAPSKTMQAFADMEKICEYKDILTGVNRFLFNREEIPKIAALVSSKLGRPIEDKVIELYKKYMWDVDHLNAKECFVYYKPFRSSAVITIDGLAITLEDESNAKITDSLLTDDNYFKWKAGVKVDIGDINERLREVVNDCYFKLKESIHTTQVVEKTKMDGIGVMGDPVDMTTTSYKNVQRETSKVAKTYLDMLLKANGSIKMEDKGAADAFFERLNQVAIEFPDEKIATYHDVFEDVREDIK